MPSSHADHLPQHTAALQALLDRRGISGGVLMPVGQHSTPCVALNENEKRLLAELESVGY
ncbi:hypothetical protein [Synechococcus sp. CS-1328]|uniref:hypothetical protein n=1 Tax=Synechococcus sp. CS-1328 TaxID=2847976 RepID=UPI00223BBFF4|nr:hypothetical protein [Synechococcus sp. CS-1328]MCT0225484.1 hypothetical protein [Synechococcus sp. CS-1328]